jgi:hypothetical protein
MSRQSRIFGYGLSGMLVLAGALAAVFLSGGIGEVLTFVLIALGFVLATSLLFYEVGLSEDRALEREARERVARKRVNRRFRFSRERDHSRRLR